MFSSSFQPFKNPFRCCCPICRPSIGCQSWGRLSEIYIHQWYGPFSVSYLRSEYPFIK